MIVKFSIKKVSDTDTSWQNFFNRSFFNPANNLRLDCLKNEKQIKNDHRISKSTSQITFLLRRKEKGKKIFREIEESVCKENDKCVDDGI